MESDENSKVPLTWAKAFPWLAQYVRPGATELHDFQPRHWDAEIDDSFLASSQFRKAIAAEVLAHFGHWQVGQLFSTIPISLDVFSLAESVRLTNVLKRNGIKTFDVLESMSINDLMNLRNVGFNTISELIGILFQAEVGSQRGSIKPEQLPRVDTALADPSEFEREDSEPNITELLTNIKLVANWAAANRKDEFGLFAPDLDVPDAPDIVRGALDRLAVLATSSWADEKCMAPLVEHLGQFVQTLDSRELAIINRRIIAEKQETLEAISSEFDISRERVRQIEATLLSKIGALFVSGGEFAYHSASIRNQLKPIASVQKVLETLSGLSEYVDSLEEPVWVIFDKFDNSIESDGTWIAKESLAAVESAFSLQFSQNATEPGLISLENLKSVFGDWVSLADDELLAYAKSLGYFEFFGHLASPQIDSLQDKIFAFFEISGSPASAEEISEALRASHSIGSIKNALSADTRLLRVGKKKWGLRDWDFQEFTTIREKVIETIRENGPTLIDDLVLQITQQFEVSPRSVTVYASSWPLQLENGLVQFATEKPTPKRTFAETKGLFAHANTTLYRIRITRDHLRGSGMAIPTALAQAIGLEFGSRAQLSAGTREISVSWANTQPSLGSIRSLLGDVDVEIGDLVFLQFQENRIDLIPIRNPENSITSKVCSLMGVSDSGESLERQIAKAIRIGDSSGWGGVLPALRLRGESEILGFLSEGQKDDLLFSIQVEAPRNSKLKIVGLTDN